MRLLFATRQRVSKSSIFIWRIPLSCFSRVAMYSFIALMFFPTVYKFDRFSRNKYETAIHKKTLRDNGVKVISATEHIPDRPEGIIFESMLEGYAEYYSAELSQKVRRGMNETRLKGNYTGGHILYGYKKQDKKLVIDEKRAEVVRFIFEQYSIGVYSLSSTAPQGNK